MGAENEGRQDREAGVLGGFGGVPALVEVLPPLLIARAEGQEQVRGREQRNDREPFDGEDVIELFRAERDPMPGTRRFPAR